MKEKRLTLSNVQLYVQGVKHPEPVVYECNMLWRLYKKVEKNPLRYFELKSINNIYGILWFNYLNYALLRGQGWDDVFFSQLFYDLWGANSI